MSTTTARSHQTCILSIYPLTREFQARIGELAGPDPISLQVSELRQHGLAGMLRKLRSRRIDKVLLPIENQEGEQLLPVLKLLASVMPARGIYVLGSDLRTIPVDGSQVAASTFQLIRASAHGIARLRQAGRETARLLEADRIDPPRPRRADVLYLNANLWFGVKAGGSVGHISGVANGLIDAGHPLTFATAGGRLLVREDAKLVTLAPPRQFGLPWEYNFYRFHFDVVDHLSRILEHEKPGFIYQRLSICNYSGVQLSRRLAVPLILEYNGSEVWVARNWGRSLRSQRTAERVEAANLRHAHMLVTISDVLRDDLIERGVAPERIVTYPNCIDPSAFDPARFTPDDAAALRARQRIDSQAVLVTFIGTFGQWHGASVLAEAVRELLDHSAAWVRERRLHFMFVGDGIKMGEVRAVLGPHLPGPHVTLTGLVPQAEAPRYLAASDILASPHVPNADGSRFFGSPTKLFEYMAMGKAIIASDLDQIGDVLRGSLRLDDLPDEGAAPQERTGAVDSPPALLVAPGSAREIVAGLKFLAGRPEWRSALGANARRLALANYTWRHHVDAILQRARALGLAAAPDRD